MLKGLSPLKSRLNYDKMSNWGSLQNKDYTTTMGDRVNVRGVDPYNYADPLIRLREDKLRSLKSALFNSYQSAIIQFDRDDRQYKFRCLINHDKLKVDYEDKILSIPFREVPVDLEDSNLPLSQKMVDTGTSGNFLDELGNPVLDGEGQVITQYRVKPGDVFKWLSGNEGYMPDSYWIIYLQYSEQTAYFRGQIRKADDEIEIIPIDSDGNEGDPLLYRGWTTGPNEDEAIWNVKKGVVWNDLYYTKILYITKDETTSAYFRRFDRIIINGQPWQVQGYNDNYGTTSKNSESGGIIRVALKETYTSTNQVIKNMKEEEEEKPTEILGPTTVQTYDVVTYHVPNGDSDWNIPAAAPFKELSRSATELKLEVLQVDSKSTIEIGYNDAILKVTIKPFK